MDHSWILLTEFLCILKNVLEADCSFTANVIKRIVGVEFDKECYGEMLFWKGDFRVLHQVGNQRSCVIYDGNQRTCNVFRGPKGVSSCPEFESYNYV